MKAFAFVIALAACAGAKAFTTDEVPTAAETVAPSGAVPEASEATPVGSVAPVQSADAARSAEAVAAPLQPAVPQAAQAAGENPGRVAVIRESAPVEGCGSVELYSRTFLSGPWSVSRRLEAARIRGDEREVRRMEEMLSEALSDALDAEGGP